MRITITLFVFALALNVQSQLGETHTLQSEYEMSVTDLDNTIDFDNDGDLDLVGGYYSQVGNVNVLRNDGNRVFTATIAYQYDFTLMSFLTSEDFDNNGLGDLYFRDLDGDYFIQFQTAPNDFGPPVYSSQSFVNYSLIAMQDMNLDAIMDVIIFDGNIQSITIYVGNGAGDFTPWNLPQTGGYVPASFLQFTLLDLDQDGDKEMLTMYQGNEAIIYLENNGDNFDTTWQYIADIPLFGSGNIFFKAADVDGDGAEDLITSTTELQWWKNLGEFQFDAPISLGEIGANAGFALADFNTDGAIDIFRNDDSTPAWLQNDGSGNFPTYVDLGLLPNITVKSEDYDNDGHMDVLATDQFSNGATGIHWNNGNGDFEAKQVITYSQLSGNQFLSAIPTKEGMEIKILATDFANSGTAVFETYTTTADGEYLNRKANFSGQIYGDAGEWNGTVRFG